MSKKKLTQIKRGGFALALVLCGIILMLIVGVGVLSLGTSQRMLGVRTSSEIAARSAADAGMIQALYSMNKMLDAKNWNDNSLPQESYVPLPNTDASYSYQVTKISAADSNDDTYTIKCIGKSGRRSKAVNCTLELKSIFEYAIFGSSSITLKNGTTVGSYNVGADDTPLQIGTNSTDAGAITTKVGVTIDGDVVVGAGGDPSVVIDSKFEAAITGDTYPLIIKNKMPSVTVPQYLVDMASSGDLTTSTTLSGPAKYDSINLLGTDPNKGDVIKINGAVELYVVGDIRLGNNDKITIVDANTNPNASLTIYVGGNILLDNGASINNLTEDAHKLKIFGLDTCTNIDFKNSGSFYGAIYAPQADIHFYNSVSVYGSAIGNSFTQDASANFYYDMSLREANPTEIGVQLKIKRWSE